MELTGYGKEPLLHNPVLPCDVGRLIPWRVKRAFQPMAFGGGMFALRHGFWNTCALRWLRMGWANEGWSADTSYLEAVCHWASRVRGPILECGSGLTTLLLGVVARDQVITLEHMPEWKDRVQLVARKHSVPVNVVNAPIVDYGGFHWYSVPKSLPGNIELVICDGPPSDVLGGRYGLLPVTKSLLSRNAVILMDDIERSDEQAVVACWNRRFGIHCKAYQTPSGAYAVATLENSAVLS